MRKGAAVVGIALALLMAVVGLSCQYLPDSCQLFGNDAPVKVGQFMWVKDPQGLAVEVTPTERTEAFHAYVLDLYERGEYRTSTTVRWLATELNAGSMKWAKFELLRPEDRYYEERSGPDLATVFDVKVRD